MTLRCISTVHNIPNMRYIRVTAATLPLVVTIALEAQSTDVFESKVRPILAANCYDCHTDERMGGLRLDSREALLKGGNSGQPAVVPGDPDKSLLIQAVKQTTEKLKMPKGGRLRPDEIETLGGWVKAGPPWPSSAAASTSRNAASVTEGKPAAATTAATTAAPEGPALPETSAPAYVIKPEQRAFWSFQPLRKPPVPAVSHES